VMSGITSPVKKISSVVSNEQGQLAEHSKEHSSEVNRIPSEYTQPTVNKHCCAA
jgi:hypothetical protein